MPSQLSSVPVARRRRAAAACGVAAVLLVAVGVLPWAGSAPTALRVLSVVVLVAAVVVALIGWGLLAGVRADTTEARVDAAIIEAVEAAGFAGCDCGVEHDPDEMHITDACPSEGTCGHDCATCKLAALKG
ncbi:MAG TPA: hypothetical protein VH373_07685 [Jatrophihabitantaceae bacterium]|jgi:hypothetical protein